MLGDIGTLHQEEAQAGSDKEYMEIGEHKFCSVDRSWWTRVNEKRSLSARTSDSRSNRVLEHLPQAALRFQIYCDKESHNPRSIIDYPRFIPNREGQDLQASFSLLHDEGSPATPSKQKKRTPHGELHFQKSK
jgi:hypothetical protein